MLYICTADDLAELVAHCNTLVISCYSDWCPASSQSKPVFEMISATYANRADFAKVRTDVSPEVAGILMVKAIPTFYAVRSGQILSIMPGAASEARLIDWMTRAFGWLDHPA
ncbi:thioredoxin family protein [Nocardia sp. NBC_01377]|uniref:thioredoxin family protein n=1 Tax=Nocardia sp. NBC_01377 TaxID=2903595 RepID=UPI003868EE5F